MKIVDCKVILKKYKGMYNLLKELYYILYKIKFDFFASLRKIGLLKSKYNKLKEIKGCCEGDSCFIVATGPSLRYEDLEILKENNVLCFSVNSILLALKNCSWRPDYYGIQDLKSYEILQEHINEYAKSFKKIFVSNSISDIGMKIPNDSVIYPLDLMNHMFTNHKSYNAKFSEDPCVRVYDGYSVVFSMIQIAVYMGFKRIYLLGVDCNYSNPNSQFINYGRNDESNLKAKERMTIGYRVAKEYIKNKDIEIYNATRGGMLEEFPRVDFDKLFSD